MGVGEDEVSFEAVLLLFEMLVGVGVGVVVVLEEVLLSPKAAPA